MEDEILEFINRRFKKDCNWLDGNCYYFAKILQIRFPKLQLVYLPIEGHFMARDTMKNRFYDWSGAYSEDEVKPFYIWSLLQKEEPALYKRILEDCVK